jgi:nucleoside-diphosphate-sugar epimerase
MRALVTGANGFLGRHVVSALLKRGEQVRALVRPAARIEDLAWPASVDVFRADLRSAAGLARAFEGVDVLVHLAADVTGGEDAQLAATVGGTERLLGAMASTPCKRLVLASSFSVYDWSKIHGTLDESSPLEQGADLYARDGYSISKSWQERVVRRATAQHGWDLTVLRPGFIWGRDHAYLAALGQQIGRLHLVIGPAAHIPMTHVENCADLFALASVDPRARGETFNVVDGEGERIWSFLGDYLRGMGERGFRIPIPYHLAYFGVSAAFSTIFRRNLKLPQILIPCRFESRLKPLRYTNRRAHDILGWTPPLEYQECLARTFAPEERVVPPVRAAEAEEGRAM